VFTADSHSEGLASALRDRSYINCCMLEQEREE